MKRTTAILLALLMVLSLAACGRGSQATPTHEPTEEPLPEQTPEPKPSKGELLEDASTLTSKELEKCINNFVYAKSLSGNTYTFNGTIHAIKEDCAEIEIQADDSVGLVPSTQLIVGNVYLPIEDLIELESWQYISFVGTLSGVTSFDNTDSHGITRSVIQLAFDPAEIAADRFEHTGTLDSKNESYGNNAWNIKYPNNDRLVIVYFTDDVSAYIGEEITFSYKYINDGNRIDAMLVE